jgi:hypothetical protein
MDRELDVTWVLQSDEAQWLENCRSGQNRKITRSYEMDWRTIILKAAKFGVIFS